MIIVSLIFNEVQIEHHASNCMHVVYVSTVSSSIILKTINFFECLMLTTKTLDHMLCKINIKCGVSLTKRRCSSSCHA